jgi:DNA-directed RNA polymerase subunit alpha
MDPGIDIKEIVLSNSTFGPQEIRRITAAISEDFAKHSVLRESVAELQSHGEQTPASAVRLGVCLYLLGRFREAIRTSVSGRWGSGGPRFYQGRAHFEVGEYANSVSCYEAAKVAGYDPDLCALATAEALRYDRQHEQAMNVLDQLFGPIEQTAEYLYQRGATVAAIGGYPEEVVRCTSGRYRLTAGIPVPCSVWPWKTTGGAMISWPWISTNGLPAVSRRISEPWSIWGICWRICCSTTVPRRAISGFWIVFPVHDRARLYYKDATASCDMFYDEEARKRNDRLTQLLNIPVTDFELSVRSRNCLQKMGVRTLGDLTRTSEAELLASKNFGETSLVEIRDMLSSKGLELGQFASERPEPAPVFDVSRR